MNKITSVLFKRVIIPLLGLLMVQAGFSHYKARYHVIVDTDGGVDDFRTICMLLASPEIEVIAITTTDGILDPETASQKITSLMKRFGHEGIPVGMGKKRPGHRNLPVGVSEIAEVLSWGIQSDRSPESLPGAIELISESLELEEMPVDVIALGPLTNIAGALQADAGFKAGIRRIYWYNEGTGEGGFNHDLDPQAAEMVFNSELAVDFVHSGGGGDMIIDLEELITALDTIRSDYARALKDFYQQCDSCLSTHYMGTCLGDDCIPIYMIYPEHFSVAALEDQPDRQEIRANASPGLRHAMLWLLASDREDKSIIFKRFPVEQELFEEDVADMAARAIDQYGLKEWKILVLTNEFHEHLGIYSIIGAKMGLRAREYFHIGIDELTIESHAGSLPPVSCLNDGLQASTGATLGHGTIKVREERSSPEARFTFKNSTIEIRVREDIRDRIRKDVQNGVQQYGLDSTEYWDYIRKLALQYWITLDRREIFEIIPVAA